MIRRIQCGFSVAVGDVYYVCVFGFSMHTGTGKSLAKRIRSISRPLEFSWANVRKGMCMMLEAYVLDQLKDLRPSWVKSPLGYLEVIRWSFT